MIESCLAAMDRIYHHRKLRFDFTHGTRERVTKGFTYEKGQGSGRSKTPKSYADALTRCLAESDNLMFLYPGHYDLAVVDIDTPHNKELLDFLPPLHHSPSRSGARRGGHLWYPRPRYPGDLKPLTPRSFHLRGTAYTVDVQYTQLIRVPSLHIPGVLNAIADWLDDPPSPVSFPYELLGLALQPGERDNKLWHYILAQTEQLGDPDYVSQERWYEVATEIGYFVDNTEQAFEETFRKATEKASLNETTESEQTFPFSGEGADGIFAALPYRYRFNLRTGHTEISDTSNDWQSLGHDRVRRRFAAHIRKTFRETRGKGEPPQWEPLKNWGNFIEWLDTYAEEQEAYDPVAIHLEGWSNSEPLPTKWDAQNDPTGEGRSLLLNLFAPGIESPLLRQQIFNVELNLLLLLGARLVTGHHGEPDDIHFPYLVTFVGPPGCGKSRLCRSLGLAKYHTNDISFGDPPKEFGERAQIAIVAEMEELKEMLGRRGSQLRGQAKKYINQTKFDYRAAYARGAKASTYHLMGVLLGTSNYPVDMGPEDGLWRRIVHLPVHRHPRFTGNLYQWDTVFDEWFPRAMSRALIHFARGKLPALDEIKIIESLHKLIYDLEVVNHQWQRRSVDGDEFT